MFLGAALCIFALVSCQKEADLVTIDADVETIGEKNHDNVGSVPFELVASINNPADTKTTLDTGSWAVDWEDGDDIIYAVTTDEEWGVKYALDNPAATVAEFTYDSSSDKFTTASTISAGEHTFNFLYTNGAQKSYHRGAGTTFSLATNQAFDASAPTANLKNYDALAAQLTATTPTTFASVDMSHLFTLMKVTLKNKTGDAITATKFEITTDSGTNLYGIYDVTFGTTPSVSYNKNGGTTLSVDITNGAIANDGTLDVYFVMAPLSSYTGNLTMRVTDGDGNSYSKTNAVTGVTLAAGTYNTASFSCKTPVVDYVTLDWESVPEGDSDGLSSTALGAIAGVTVNTDANDYAAGNAPYLPKFSTTGHYVKIKTDSQIDHIVLNVKGFSAGSGSTYSSVVVYGSENGSNWTEVETFSVSTTTVLTFTSTNPFNASDRYVKIEFTKAKNNLGIGRIAIYKPNTDPAIEASDINNVPAVGCTDQASTYTVKNFDDDVEVDSFSGCVSAADATTGDILYSVTPNYASTAATGTIVLQSAGNSSATKTINVHQLGSSLSVSKTEVIIPANEDDATFTITSPEFDWTISADDDSHIVIDDSGSASSDAATVTVESDITASDEVQTIATLTIIRNSNSSDPQAKQVVIKKAASGVTTYTVNTTGANCSKGVQNYTSEFSITDGGLTLNLANFNNNNKGWTFVKAGARKANTTDSDKVTTGTISAGSITEAIKTVTVSLTLDRGSATAILYVASDSDFTTNLQTINYGSVASGDVPFTVTTPTGNCYYKIEFTCTNTTTTNGVISVSKVTYSTN